MIALIRFYGTGIVLSVALAGASVVCPRWPELLGLEVASRRQTGSREGLAPGKGCEVYKARIDAKVQIVTRLRAGELDLFEAAAWFACVNQEPAEYADKTWEYTPGNSKEEKLCRQVILWAKAHLSHSTPESAVDLFVEELEAKLSARLCERGRVELPDWR